MYGPDLATSAHHATAAASAGDGEEDAVAEFAVFEAACVEGGGAVLEDGLDFGDEEIAFAEEGADG